jgi:hypothetical protein
MHAARLEALIWLHRLNQTEEWLFRVNQSAAHKLLVGRDGTVKAISEPVLAVVGRTHSDVIGRNVWDFLGLDAEIAAKGVLSREAARKGGVGFFDGRVRQMKFMLDMRRADMTQGSSRRGEIPGIDGVSRWGGDIWPLLTAQDHLYAHVTATPIGATPDTDWDGRYRIVSFRLTPIVQAEGFDGPA